MSLAALVMTAGALALAPSAASADGDPASDILLYQDAYLPYGQVLPARLQQNVQQVTGSANGAGLPLRVAVLGSENDMGAVVSLYGKPQQYARYLHGEFVAGPAATGATPTRPPAPGRVPPRGPRRRPCSS